MRSIAAAGAILGEGTAYVAASKSPGSCEVGDAEAGVRGPVEEFRGRPAVAQHRRRHRPDLHQPEFADRSDSPGVVVALDERDRLGERGRDPAGRSLPRQEFAIDGLPTGRDVLDATAHGCSRGTPRPFLRRCRAGGRRDVEEDARGASRRSRARAVPAGSHHLDFWMRVMAIEPFTRSAENRTRSPGFNPLSRAGSWTL